MSAREEIEREMAARALDPELEALVKRSTLVPERAWQHATLRWLRGCTPEERDTFRGMLERLERKNDAEAQDEALVDRILAQEGGRA